jgi:hypothetical protein
MRNLPVLACFAALVGLLTLAGPAAFASGEQHVDDGLVASKNWIGQIDAGRYDDSYSAASGEMRDKVPQDRWSLVLKSIRDPWGAVVNRHQLSHVYKPNGFEGTEGEFLVITYDTSFQKLPEATELVVLRWEDGQWRGAGYNAGPKPSADNSGPTPPDSTTQVQTQDHVKPVQQHP